MSSTMKNIIAGFVIAIVVLAIVSTMEVVIAGNAPG